MAAPVDSPPRSQQVPEDPWRILRWRSRQQAYREDLGDEVKLTLMRIPAGSFLKGAAEGEEGSGDSDRPVHRVELKEFLMGQTPVTQAQWRVVARWQPQTGEQWGRELKADPSDFQGDAARLLEGESNTDNHPVESVNWYEAMEFCSRLSQRSGKRYTLPSEAQWEYACRAGTTTPFHFGETITPDLANYDGKYTYGSGPKGKYRGQTTDVASLPANAWGLHDMHGNVLEWCEDHWHDSYSVEGSKAPEDGSAWIDAAADKETNRLLRGGSWYVFPRYCRSAYRYRSLPVNRYLYIGFRVCCLPQDFLLTS